MNVLMYPVSTEKALTQVDRDNIITYVVKLSATKHEIKSDFEKMFKVKIEKISTATQPDNVKKAYIRLGKDFPASDIAKRLKLV